MAWVKSMKNLTSGLTRVDAVRLPGLQDPLKQWCCGSVMQSVAFLYSKPFFPYIALQPILRSIFHYSPSFYLSRGCEPVTTTGARWLKVDGCPKGTELKY